MSFLDSTYRKLEASFVFTKEMNDEFGEKFKRKTFGNKNTENLTAYLGIVKIK